MSAALGDLTWPELTSPRGVEAALVVPVGSTEQHGPHLPLSTDTDIAVGIAERLAAISPGTIVAPPIPYGSSGEHESFPGTISIGSMATTSLIVELVRSASATFRNIVLLSTHGGNAQAVHRAAGLLAEEGRGVLIWSPRWDGDAHAGRTETSLMLALRPELVRLEAAVAGNRSPLHELWPALRSGGLASVAPTGILGDPMGASAREGRRLLAATVDDLQTAIARWSGRG